MRRPPYLWHVTLQSGHARKTYRSEIDERLIDACRPLLAADGEHPIPFIPAARSLLVSRSGKQLLATVMAGPAPICTIGVALKSRGSAKLWDVLHSGCNTDTHRADQAAPPWIAARLEIGINLNIGDAEWLGDFERGLGWTWVALHERDEDDDD